MNDIAMCISLCIYISDSLRTSGMEGTILNAMSNDEYLEKFWMPKIFGHLGRYFWYWTWDWAGFGKCRNLTLLGLGPWLVAPEYSHDLSWPVRLRLFKAVMSKRSMCTAGFEVIQ